MKTLRLLLILGPLGLAAAFFVRTASDVPGDWLRALVLPDDTLPQLLLHLSAFPRFAATVLAGAALALAGALLQRLLANPLAEPGTIGVLAGTQTALTGLLIWAPGLMAALRLPVGIAGGGMAFGLVLLLAARQGLSALALILSGMVVTMVLGGLNAMLALFHHDVLQGLFLWQAGAPVQDGWSGVLLLAACLFAVAGLSPALERPLRLIETGDDTARSLGLSAGNWRAALALLAVALTAVSAATVGAVAFIGILAPNLLRRAGVTRPHALHLACAGGGLLALADQLTGILPPWLGLQTGTMLALVGAILLLTLLRTVPAGPKDIGPAPFQLRTTPAPHWLWAGLLSAALWAALALGRTPEGWHVAFWSMLEWRLPRVLAALAAGAAFGLSGAVMQRLLGNRMAGPELLGISGAASLGLVVTVLAGANVGRIGLYGGTAAGALAGLAVITAIAGRRRTGTRDLLLAGLGMSMLFSAVLAGMLASGHPKAGALLGWLSGSTYRVGLGDAVLALAAVLALLPLALLQRRWLDILPLGPDIARALGVDLRSAHAGLVMLAALGATVGTLLIGPLGFVGLLAPNIARSLTGSGAARQIPAAMACGAGLLLVSDWLGRVLIFPWQIPAGLMALFIGGGVLIVMLWRKA